MQEGEKREEVAAASERGERVTEGSKLAEKRKRLRRESGLRRTAERRRDGRLTAKEKHRESGEV